MKVIITGHTCVGAGVAIALSRDLILLTVFGGAFNGLFFVIVVLNIFIRELLIASCCRSLGVIIIGFNGAVIMFPLDTFDCAVLGFEPCCLLDCLVLGLDDNGCNGFDSGIFAYTTS